MGVFVKGQRKRSRCTPEKGAEKRKGKGTFEEGSPHFAGSISDIQRDQSYPAHAVSVLPFVSLSLLLIKLEIQKTQKKLLKSCISLPTPHCLVFT